MKKKYKIDEKSEKKPLDRKTIENRKRKAKIKALKNKLSNN